MGQRRESRDLALCALYSLEFNPGDYHGRLRRVCETALSPEAFSFAESLTAGVLENRDYLDRLIAGFALNWSLDRVALIERQIMRLALFEMLLLVPPGPPAVVINEAVELARKYGAESSWSFVNGVLDRARAELSPGKTSSSRKDP